MGFYDYEANDKTGVTIKMEEYKGKVVLVVNTATKCGFTPQYDDLQDLYEVYQEQGLEILDFPCNQFGNQAPGTDEEIASFCDSRYGITFPHFAKIDVNGENADPLYTYLKKEQPFKDITGKGARKLKLALKVMNRNYKDNDDIKWNFTKFLVDREGNVVQRFEPTEDLNDVKEKIKELL